VSLDREGHARRGEEIAKELAAQGVRAVALTAVDNAGITRVKVVPVARFGHVAAWGVGMSPVFDVFLLDDSITTSAYAGGRWVICDCTPTSTTSACSQRSPGGRGHPWTDSPSRVTLTRVVNADSPVTQQKRRQRPGFCSGYRHLPRSVRRASPATYG
jgi:hypothetical protein